ncbi:unnamed protein product [Sympodiomycopsis kandeliae]
MDGEEALLTGRSSQKTARGRCFIWSLVNVIVNERTREETEREQEKCVTYENRGKCKGRGNKVEKIRIG